MRTWAHRAPPLRSGGRRAPPPPPGRGTPRSVRGRSTGSRTATSCSCTGSSSGGSIGAERGLGASRRWWPPGSRSSSRPPPDRGEPLAGPTLLLIDAGTSGAELSDDQSFRPSPSPTRACVLASRRLRTQRSVRPTTRAVRRSSASRGVASSRWIADRSPGCMLWICRIEIAFEVSSWRK